MNLLNNQNKSLILASLSVFIFFINSLFPILYTKMRGQTFLLNYWIGFMQTIISFSLQHYKIKSDPSLTHKISLQVQENRDFILLTVRNLLAIAVPVTQIFMV
jgi:hypothetical protein